MRRPYILLIALLATARARAQNDVVDKAMHDEMARTMKSLRLGQLDRPYFVSYQVVERDYVTAAASYGSLLSSDQSQTGRHLHVEVRVGDYALDNTNALSLSRMGERGFSTRDLEGEPTLPRGDDYFEVRRQIWLATDAAYKQALESMATKRAAMVNRTQTTQLADFSHEPATQTVDTVAITPPGRAEVEALARALSETSASPTIYTSRVSVASSVEHVRYINSEGTSATMSRPLIIVTASASTQATDGMRLGDGVTWYARRLDSLPPRDVMIARIRAMQARLDSLRTAPLLEHYDGPVVFAGLAAAEAFRASFAPALIGRRLPVVDNAQEEAMLGMMMQHEPSFGDKLGGRVLPEFMRVVDDPTAPYLGRYTVDDEGVRARSTVVIDSGLLKTLLTTRVPVEGVDHSTGNRHGFMATPSNLIVTATNGVTDTALVAQMMALVKRRGLPYGIIVRKLGETSAMEIEEGMVEMMNQDQRLQRAARVYRVYPDGRQELVRGANLSGFGPSAFKDILAASNVPVVVTSSAEGAGAAMAMMGMIGIMSSGGGSGAETELSSFIVPSLLFDDVSFTASRSALPRPPISAPPM